MGFIELIIWLIIVVLPIYDVLKHGKSAGYKATWIAIILILPLIGTGAYLLAGRTSGSQAIAKGR